MSENEKAIDSSDIQKHELTYKKLALFSFPLVSTMISISLSHLILTRCLGFFPNPELYISSFNVARSFIILLQFPLAALTLTITTFTVNKATFKKVKKYIFSLIILLTIWLIVISYTNLGKYILSNFYNLDGELLQNAVTSLKIVIFFPILVAIRSYFLGVALKLRKLKFAAFGSFFRLLSIFLCSFFIPDLLKVIKPQYLPGLLMILMGFVEVLFYAFGLIRLTKGRITNHIIYSMREQNIYFEEGKTSYRKFLVFGIPLMISFLIAQFLPSLTHAALALSDKKITVLAVYTISMSVINLFSSIRFQLPQVVVNHNSFNVNDRSILIRSFLLIAGVFSIFLAVIAFTPVGSYIFIKLLNVSESSTKILKLTCAFGILNPAAAIFGAYKRGKLFKIKKTGMLVFERIIGAFLPYILFFLIPIIKWEYAAALGVLMLAFSDIISGLFNSIVFKINVKRDPGLISSRF